jgi:hypothetical protein
MQEGKQRKRGPLVEARGDLAFDYRKERLVLRCCHFFAVQTGVQAWLSQVRAYRSIVSHRWSDMKPKARAQPT